MYVCLKGVYYMKGVSPNKVSKCLPPPLPRIDGLTYTSGMTMGRRPSNNDDEAPDPSPSPDVLLVGTVESTLPLPLLLLLLPLPPLLLLLLLPLPLLLLVADPTAVFPPLA